MADTPIPRPLPVSHAVPRTLSLRTEPQLTQPCPRCGYAMPALRGGTASICTNCGFKDSCCY